MVMYKVGAEPTWSTIPTGVLFFNTANNIPLYSTKSGAGAADQWDYFFGFIRASLAAASSIDAANDKLLIYDTSEDEYKTVIPSLFTSGIQDIYVKMKSGSSSSVYLSDGIGGATNGGLYFDTIPGTPTATQMLVHASVAAMAAAEAGSIALTNKMAISYSGHTSANPSVSITLQQANEIMKFINLYDTPANYTSSGGYVLMVNSGATAVEFKQYVPVSAGGTNANLSASATGSLIYYNSGTSAFVALTGGTSGYVLKSNGNSAAPSWVAKWTSEGFSRTFNNSTDWTPSGGDETHTILASAHGLGTGFGFCVQVYETNAGQHDLVDVEVNINNSTGDITLVSSAPFAGYVVILKA